MQPLAVVVCPGWKKAQLIFEVLGDYNTSSRPLHPVLLTIGLHKDEAKSMKLPRSCEHAFFPDQVLPAEPSEPAPEAWDHWAPPSALASATPLRKDWDFTLLPSADPFCLSGVWLPPHPYWAQRGGRSVSTADIGKTHGGAETLAVSCDTQVM